jgi:hypothetical protein
LVDADDDALVHQDGCKGERMSACINEEEKTPRLTQRVKVEGDGDALGDRLVSIPLGIHLDLLNRQRIEPHPNLPSIPAPERILERSDAGKVSPVEFDSVGEDLHVVFDLFVGCSTRAKEDEFAVDEEDDGSDVEVVCWVAETC